MKRIATLVRCAALIGAALTLCTAAAHACSAVAAPAVHTAAHARHHAHGHFAHTRLVHHASFRNAPATRLPALPARAPAHHSEHKAALPTTLHTLRHAPGSHARFGASLHSMLASDLTAPKAEYALSFADLDYSPGMSLTLAGRAPPRAGPSDALALLPPRRPFTPRRAGLDPSTLQRSHDPIPDARVPARSIGYSCCAPLPVSPEQPSGRSHADRPEGAAAWRTMPSSRGLS